MTNDSEFNADAPTGTRFIVLQTGVGRKILPQQKEISLGKGNIVEKIESMGNLPRGFFVSLVNKKHKHYGVRFYISSSEFKYLSLDF